MLDRRGATRRRTFLKGRVEVDALNGWTVECPVRNLSDGGACLMLPENIVVPSAFTLEITGRPARPARLIWYGGGRAGVAFTRQAA